MTEFRFIHTSDLHLGRRFSTIPDEALRGRLVEARFQAIAHLSEAAVSFGAEHILVAGDVFHSQTPTPQVRDQALDLMAEGGVHWWLLPGNHDSLAAEALWSAVAARAAPTVHVLRDGAPLPLAPGTVLLPAPLDQRYPGRDPTADLAALDTDPALRRIGLAHGPVRGFGDNDPRAAIPPNRAVEARLDYLALGDWHGQSRIAARTWYSGTPERDSFRHSGAGACLAVTLGPPGSEPTVEPVRIGRFAWQTETLTLTPASDALAGLEALLSALRDKRDTLLRLVLAGRAPLAAHQALRDAAADAAPRLAMFTLDSDALRVEHDLADLDRIAAGGALRTAAEALAAEAAGDDLGEDARGIAAAALRRLYGLAQEVDR